MNYSAKRGIEIACRLSVCNVGGSGSHKLEILETRGGVGKSGVLVHKSGNISKTCKEGLKVTMQSL